MAQLEIIALDTVDSELQAPEAGDSYVANRPVHLTDPLTTDSTIDGRDVAADGALVDTAVQPGDNISELTNDSGFEANAALASQAEAEAGTENTKTMTPLRVAQAIAILAAGIKHNYGSSVDPVATNDDSEGYSPGSFWINTTADTAFRCVDSTTNVAVWVDTTLSTSDLAAVALSGDSDDLSEGVANLLLTPTERIQIAEGWKDLTMDIVGAAAGGGTPALDFFGPTGVIKQMKFGVGDSVYVAGHIDHDIKPGSTMYPHVHWSTDGTDTNSVKWQLTYVAAAGHNQANFGVDTVVNVEEAAQGSAWRHMVTEDATGFAALEVDSLVIMEVKRVTNGGTDNTDKVFGLYVDLHYLAGQFATPNRVPDFYA